MLKLGVFAVLLALAIASQEEYNNYKVFKVTPRNEFQMNLLHHMAENDDEYSFWQPPSFVNRSADVMIAPKKLSYFKSLMNSTGIEHEMFIENVQELIDNENPHRSKLIRASDFDWTSYHTLYEIYEWLDSLEKKYPNLVKVIVAGKTSEGRVIKGVKVSYGEKKTGENKPAVVLESNIHAREWITSATTTFILNELLTSKDPAVRELAEANDWYIFPVVNPDGFVYSHEKNRLWRKTRTLYSYWCRGADPNRNWDYKWNQGGASSFPCAETYAGSKPFSDIEMKSYSEYLSTINKFYAYIAFHSYSQLLLFPYGHTVEHLDNYDELLSIGTKTIGALAKRYGTEYKTGNIAETIYVATGSSMDYVKATHGPQLTYTYELRDTGRHGFLLPAEQIIPTGEETLDSLIAMFTYAKKYGIPY